MTWRDVGNLRGEMGATGPQGATGETGPAGAPFTIYRTYATIALMEADFANVPDGSFVAIQSNVEDKFAEKMLDGEINAKDNVIVKYSDGEVKIEKVANK